MPRLCHTGCMPTLEELLERKQLRTRLPSPTVRRALREDVGLSQLDIADLVGATPAAVSRWEAGLREPTGERLERYLDVLERLRSSSP